MLEKSATEELDKVLRKIDLLCQSIREKASTDPGYIARELENIKGDVESAKKSIKRIRELT